LVSALNIVVWPELARPKIPICMANSRYRGRRFAGFTRSVSLF
jgi:hypothetical protein